jgi:hypothetical protein
MVPIGISSRARVIAILVVVGRVEVVLVVVEWVEVVLMVMTCTVSSFLVMWRLVVNNLKFTVKNKKN